LVIPAITIGRGGTGENAHSLDEWWFDEKGYEAVQYALLVLLAEAGI
jgi:tripeptide aminopeptidase